MIKCTLYDIIEQKDIDVPELGFMSYCKEILRIDYTNICHLLSGKIISIKNRYILKKDIDKIFSLTDIDSGKSYQCINGRSIFIHFGLPYNANEGKYVYELKSGRQIYASICGRVMSLNGRIRTSRVKSMKNPSTVVTAARRKSRQKTRIRTIISSIIARYVRGHKSKDELLSFYAGCNPKKFMRYLKGRFTKGMNWNNYGEWHIDHIKPCARFNLHEESELFKCFHYTNLQPIWATSEIASKYNEIEYIGNLNKNDTMSGLDCFLSKLIYSKGLMSKEKCDSISMFLYANGIRKTS